MNRVIAFLVSLLILHAAGAKELASPEQLEQWMTYYYLDPTPGEIPKALEAVSTLGLFENDAVQAPLSGFFAEVFRANPAALHEWVKPFVGVPKRHILYSALWMAGSTESKAALAELALGALPEEARQLKSLAESTPPTINSMEVNSPAPLDYLWGCFMASGAEDPVLRIIDQVKLVNVKGDAATMMIGGAAQWSLSANSGQHEKVLQIVRARAKTADPETKAQLEIILSLPERDRTK